MSTRSMGPIHARSDSRQHRDSGSRTGRDDAGGQVDCYDKLNDFAARQAREREERRKAAREFADEVLPPAFKVGVAAWEGGQEGFAAHIGIARSSLVEMCNGTRDGAGNLKHVIQSAHWLALAAQPTAFAAFLSALGPHAHLIVTSIVLPRLTVAQLLDDVLDFFRDHPDFYRSFREWEKARRNVTDDEVDAVRDRAERQREIDEPAEQPPVEQQHQGAVP